MNTLYKYFNKLKGRNKILDVHTDVNTNIFALKGNKTEFNLNSIKFD